MKSKWAGLIISLLLFSGILGSTISCRPVAPASPAVSSPAASLPTFSGVAEKALPSVVYFYVETTDQTASGNAIAAAGSGVILSADGYILTNRHVVDKATSIQVILHDRRSYNVSLSNVWKDCVTDLAVVKIAENNLPALQFASPDSIAVGDWVIAIGHALGLSPIEGGATVTDGIVSNLGRSFTIGDTSYYDIIQTSAAINPGNSGGPLINLAGEVVGINSAAATDAQDIGFAINVGTARHIYEDLVAYGKAAASFSGRDAG